MADLNAAYGENFEQATSVNNYNRLISLIAQNIVNHNFSFNLDMKQLWDGMNMKKEAVKSLAKSVAQRYGLDIVQLDKRNPRDLTCLKYHINGPVEYFILVDGTGDTGIVKMFTLYLTPSYAEPY